VENPLAAITRGCDHAVMFEPLLFQRLRDARHVLLAGAGGGFDVYAALPLAIVLADAGVRVSLASLSFTHLDALGSEVWLEPGIAAIRPDTPSAFDGYFPERTLARWLDAHEMPSVVYAFPKTGVQPLRAAYCALLKHLDADAVVLVDGGTDLLLRGDEAGLGTPEEDMASLAALHGIDGPVKLAASLGFGIDAYHGVNHAQVLENIADLERHGGYLGTFSVPRSTRPGMLYLDAVDHAQRETVTHPSIVHGQVAAAVRGEFGDVQFTERTRGSTLFVNPLMSLYFTFDLDVLAERNLHLEQLEQTVLIRQISSAIEQFRYELPATRKPQIIPH
jgi:hypothetical protein